MNNTDIGQTTLRSSSSSLSDLGTINETLVVPGTSASGVQQAVQARPPVPPPICEPTSVTTPELSDQIKILNFFVKLLKNK